MPFPFLAAAVGRFAVRKLFGTAARRAAAAGAGGIATGVAIDAVNDRMRGFGPSAPPQGGQRRQPEPMEGMVGRGVSRLLPGGLSGREYTPVKGTERDKYGRPIAVYPERRDRMVGPSGYVIVYPFRQGNDTGDPVAMLKGAARAMGLWSAKPKPVVSGYDTRAIARAHRAKKRVAKLAKKVAKC